MNHVEIFKRFQRLQGGTGEVRGKEPPFAEGGKWWWERADEQAKQDDEQGHGPEFAGSETPEQMLDRRRRTSYKTIGVQINGQEVEIPIWDENMTPEQAESAARDRMEMGLSPFASDMELEAKQNNNYAHGTSNVQYLAEGSSGLNYDPADPRNNLTTGFGSGAPTNKGIGLGANIAGNAVFPGLGMLTGPLAQWAWRMYQNGVSANLVQKAVQAYQAGGGQSGDTTSGQTTDATTPAATTDAKTPSAGIGIDPFGNPADPGEFWSNDFGRWGEGDQYGTTPGNYTNRAGPGGGYGTRGVWGGQTSIPISSDPNFTPSLGWAMPAASGGGAYGGNTMAKIALHSGTFKDAATPEQWNFMQNYLSGGGGGGGSGQGVGGAGRPMTQSRQKGDSDVNPGLKLFHAQLKRKKR